jgi:NLI interacting factor-like phosphatase
MLVFLKSHGYKSINFDGHFHKTLYEYEKHTKLRVLFKEEPSHVLSTSVQYADEFLREYICLQEMVIFRTVSSFVSKLDQDERIYIGLFKITQCELQLMLYPSSFRNITERADVFFSPRDPIILLDLDKTLILSECDTDEKDPLFQPDLKIAGHLAINSTPFEHSVMIRPGCHEFLKRVFQLTSKVYIITAADLHYAQKIVTIANYIGWNDKTSTTRSGIVRFPVENVYSVRVKAHTTIPKTFTQIIPSLLTPLPLVMVAVDDTLSMWAPELAEYVIEVPPFNPKTSGADEILKIVELFEKNLANRTSDE